MKNGKSKSNRNEGAAEMVLFKQRANEIKGLLADFLIGRYFYSRILFSIITEELLYIRVIYIVSEIGYHML